MGHGDISSSNDTAGVAVANATGLSPVCRAGLSLSTNTSNNVGAGGISRIPSPAGITDSESRQRRHHRALRAAALNPDAKN